MTRRSRLAATALAAALAMAPACAFAETDSTPQAMGDGHGSSASVALEYTVVDDGMTTTAIPADSAKGPSEYGLPKTGDGSPARTLLAAAIAMAGVSAVSAARAMLEGDGR